MFDPLAPLLMAPQGPVNDCAVVCLLCGEAAEAHKSYSASMGRTCLEYVCVDCVQTGRAAFWGFRVEGA